MQAHETRLVRLLDGSKQFIIPIYQRPYSWTRKQCSQLLQDTLNVGRSALVKGHFVGSVVYIQSDRVIFAALTNALLVIDGQQRLTTLSLLLAALAEQLDSRGASLCEGSMNATRLRNRYLVNHDEDGDAHFKLLLTQLDRPTLMRLIDRGEMPKDVSLRVKDNYRFFADEMAKMTVTDLEAVWQGVEKLLVVEVSLERGQDNPQLIFESLNSTGLELSQADLIRNYVLMGLEPKLQEKLYNERWFPMEEAFGQEEYAERFDRFMRDYLTVKVGSIPNIREVYAEFKRYATDKGEAAVSTLVADLQRFAGFYSRIALGTEQAKDLAEALADIRTLKVEVAYPFLLEAMDDQDAGRLSKPDLLAVFRMVETYVFRRAVCGVATNTLNRTFASLARAIDKADYVRSLGVPLATKEGNTRFPNDSEFRQELAAKNVYDFSRRDYLLTKLENFDHKENLSLADYTIEHVMPQNPDLSPEWQAELGPDWKGVQERYLHRLGNLTLTRYNSEYSDRPFAKKRDMDNGFAHSPVFLNASLAKQTRWSEPEIIARGSQLADKATKVWPYPDVADELVAAKKRASLPSDFGLDHHLANGMAVKPLFEDVRSRLLALEPAVGEKFFKHQIAYRLKHWFVTLAIRNDRLRVLLRVPKADMIDPLGLAKPYPKTKGDAAEMCRLRLRADADVDAVFALIEQAHQRSLTQTD